MWGLLSEGDRGEEEGCLSPKLELTPRGRAGHFPAAQPGWRRAPLAACAAAAASRAAPKALAAPPLAWGTSLCQLCEFSEGPFTQATRPPMCLVE